MGSHNCNPSKPHYDIALSKRTRKPLDLLEANATPNTDNPLKKASPTKADHDEEEESGDRKSLKQLINGDGGEAKKEETISGTSSSRSSLGHHFTQEEKQLQIVKKNQQDGARGVKLKGLMSRYAKVLSHLVKAKREPRLGSNKKHLLRLTM